MEGYKPGEVTKRIIGCNYCLKNTQGYSVIRSYIHNTKINDSIPGIILAEINVAKRGNVIENKYWQQGGSWHNNQFCGNQYYLESIKKDGGLYTNKGAKLNVEGKRILSYNTIDESADIIVKKDNILYLHDSDYFSSIIAN